MASPKSYSLLFLLSVVMTSSLSEAQQCNFQPTMNVRIDSTNTEFVSHLQDHTGVTSAEDCEAKCCSLGADVCNLASFMGNDDSPRCQTARCLQEQGAGCLTTPDEDIVAILMLLEIDEQVETSEGVDTEDKGSSKDTAKGFTKSPTLSKTLTLPSIYDELHREFLESSGKSGPPAPHQGDQETVPPEQRKEWSEYEKEMDEEWKRILEDEQEDEVAAWDQMYDLMEERLHGEQDSRSDDASDLASKPAMGTGLYNLIVTFMVVGAFIIVTMVVIFVRRLRYANARAYYKKLVDEGWLENQPLCPEGGVASYLD